MEEMEEEQVEKEEEVEKKEREERQEQMEAGWASPQPAAHTAAPHKCLENSCPLLHITIQCKRTMYSVHNCIILHTYQMHQKRIASFCPQLGGKESFLLSISRTKSRVGQ